jgi:asparagine synthase (glutamine-hydrolysing)
MCGILGVFDFNKYYEREHFNVALNTLTHRGPDAGNIEVVSINNCDIYLGHRRLSIIDLHATANQPMFNIHRNKVIIFNGEIYNYKQIRSELIDLGYEFKTDSDTEVILSSYEEWGESCLDKFIGMFAFAIYDLENKIAFIARDRVGVKPLYFSTFNNCFAFASELKALLKIPGFVNDIDKSALFQYFKYGYIPAPSSIYSGTFKLLPGNYIIYNIKEQIYDIKEYWNVLSFYNKPELELPYAELKENLKDIISSACNYRMVSDVPVGVFLSGGYDSSMVAAMIQKDSSNPIHTFSIGFDDEKYNEANYAKAVSNFLNTNHTEYFCSKKESQDIIPDLPYFYDEPFGDSSSIPTILVSRMAKKKVDVALSADGGDEIFGGYNKYSNSIKTVGLKNRIPSFLRGSSGAVFKNIPIEIIGKILGKKTDKDIVRKFSLALTNDLGMFDFMKLISTSNSENNIFEELFIDKTNFNIPTNFDDIDQILNIDSVNQMLAIDFKTYLPDDILTKVDRATMSVSLEGREPLLDHRLIEFSASLPIKYKINNGHKKVIFKDIVHDFIPKNIMDRPKMGFGIPVKEWMRTDLVDLFRSYLTIDKINNTGILNANKIDRMLQSYLQGDDSYFTLLWYIFNFMMWHEKWK